MVQMSDSKDVNRQILIKINKLHRTNVKTQPN